jgi:hypothetical protein
LPVCAVQIHHALPWVCTHFLSHEVATTVYCPHFDYRDKCEKSNTVNEKIIEHTVTKGNLKKKKVTHKSTQTDKEEYKPKIDIADLTSDGILH